MAMRLSSCLSEHTRFNPQVGEWDSKRHDREVVYTVCSIMQRPHATSAHCSALRPSWEDWSLQSPLKAHLCILSPQP